MWNWTHASHGRPAIVAHRGSLVSAVENTRPAIHAAVAAGADGIETDVRLCADDIPVCYHDPTLESLHGRSEHIQGLSHAEFARLVPDSLTVAEAFAIASTQGIFLDLKEEELDRVETLLRALPGHALRTRGLVGIRSLAIGRHVGRHFPHVRQIGLMRDPAELAQFVAETPHPWVRFSAYNLDPSLIAPMRDRGVRVLIVTGGNTHATVGKSTVAEVRSLAALSVDALLLTDPAMAFKGLV